MKEETKSSKGIKKHLPLIIITLLLAAAFAYNAYQDQKTKDELTKSISLLSQQLTETSKNLSGEIGILQVGLATSEQETSQKIDTLDKLIGEVEKKTNIQLSQVKDELKNINIQSQDLTVVVDEALPSVVSIITDVGKGSGAFIRAGGYVVTNVHVLAGASLARVKTYSGKTYTAGLAGYDSDADIAVLKIDADYTPLKFGDSSKLKVGQSVLAMGNPAGLEFTVTEGIVSATDRKVSGSSIEFIQTDVPINPGNSGGPLVSKEAKIVGINNWKVGGFEGLGFAIPSNLVESVTDKIIDDYEAKLAAQQNG